MSHWATLDDWDSDGINKKIQCDCNLERDHHALDGPMPSPIQPWTPLTAEDHRKVDEWISEFIKAMPIADPPSALAKPVVYEDIVSMAQKIRDSPPRWGSEPIKLTPGQWAMLPHGTPTPHLLYQPLGDLMGIPVVMVASEAESTPVAEGWIKRKPWWVRLWRKMRGKW